MSEVVAGRGGRYRFASRALLPVACALVLAALPAWAQQESPAAGWQPDDPKPALRDAGPVPTLQAAPVDVPALSERGASQATVPTRGFRIGGASLNGSDFTIDAGSAEVYLAVDGDLRQDGTEWMYNGSGTWSATGGIGLSASPIHVMGVGSQRVVALGVPPAYFYTVSPDGSLPPDGEAANGDALLWAGRAQASSSRQVAYVDVGADASNYRGYGLVEPGVRLPDDQQPECDPDFPGPECEVMQ